MDYRGFQSEAGGIAVRHWQIVPAAADLNPRPWAIFVAADGNAVIQDEDGKQLTYPVYAGQILPFSPVRVLAGTTATLFGWK